MSIQRRYLYFSKTAILFFCALYCAIGFGAPPNYATGPICIPKQVAKGESLTINAWYTLRRARPVDIHIDVLNREKKEWYAGAIIPMETQQGQVSATFSMPQRAYGDLLWKIFVTPRGEPFPNFLAESGMTIPLGDYVIDNCPKIANIGSTSNDNNTDYIIFTRKPYKLTKGQTVSFKVNYDLVSQEHADLNIAILNIGNQQYFGGNKLEISKYEHSKEVEFNVPTDSYGPVYVITYITPPGGSWKNNLAEDRIYTLDLN